MIHTQPTESIHAPISLDEQVRRVLATIDAGLVATLGSPESGLMCIEAAVCYGLGLPHGDDPGCVAEPLRHAVIQLNDADWSSSQARARGLRRLGLAQLDSKGAINEQTFVERLVRLVIGKHLPTAVRAVASFHQCQTQQAALNAAASKCESDPTLEGCNQAQNTINDAYDEEADMGGLYLALSAVHEMTQHAASAAEQVPSYLAARKSAVAAECAAWTAQLLKGGDAADQLLTAFAEDVVQLLIEINAPGCRWLYLTEAV